MRASLFFAVLLGAVGTLPSYVLAKHPAEIAQSVARENLTLNKRAACTPGTYSTTGNSPCTACSPGYYSSQSSSRSCTAARAGYYVPGSGATAESSCKAGTYSGTTASTSCSPCPAGYQCIADNTANPQKCSPGRYSTGGAVECTKCSAGTFNSIQGATSCCQCAAGYFLDQPGNVNCQKCPNLQPYSNPGSATSSSCSATKGAYMPASNSDQSADGTCPKSTMYPQPSPNSRRRVARAPVCRRSDQKPCPVYGYNWRVNSHNSGANTAYECVNVKTDLESCGGCVESAMDGRPNPDGGRDCTAIPHINAVKCLEGRCIIDSCKRGYVQDLKGEYCVKLS